MCGMSIASVKQPLMNGVAVVHRISCTAIKPRHGRGGTARHSCRLAEAAGVVVASRRVLVGAFKASGGVARSILLTEKRELMVQAPF
jgi:hypothetical protein